jgi:hypothetical protein
MIISVYPDYLNEYDEVKHISVLDIDEIDNFMRYLTGSNCWPAKKSDYIVPGNFTFEELYEPEKDWKTGEEKGPAWNGEIQYKLKNNLDTEPGSWNQSFITEENKNEMVNKLDPNGTMYFLFSLDENPNWDMQEKLMSIGERFHLG